MSLTFTANARKSTQELAEREHLLDIIQAENVELTDIAEEFYAKTNRDDATCIYYSKKIVDAVDRILKAGDWEASLFLRNTIKPVKQMREDALEILYNFGAGAAIDDEKGSVTDKELLIYVSLFQAQGSNLSQWELQLRSIDSHLISRPVYQSEEDVQKIHRLNANSLNAAYAVLKIDRSLVETEDVFGEVRRDRFGKELIVIRPGTVTSAHIVEFVHEKKYYVYRQGKLLARSQSEAVVG